MFHIIFKFSLHAWQLPRSSVGRALYRKCGPSQDGNPLPGDLQFCIIFPFFWIFCNIIFFEASLLFPFYTWPRNSPEYLCILLFLVNYVSQGFLPLICKFTLSCTLKLRTSIAMLLNLSIIKSNNKAFLAMPILIQNSQFFTQSLCTCSCSTYSSCYI